VTVRSPDRVRERDRLEVGGLCEERPAGGGSGWLRMAGGERAEVKFLENSLRKIFP
jgi:hypothetical protein